MNTPDQDNVLTAIEDARRILGEYIALGPWKLWAWFGCKPPPTWRPKKEGPRRIATRY